MAITLIFIINTLSVSSQVKAIPTQVLDRLVSKDRIYYLKDDGKTYYGCGITLEGLPIRILFKEGKINSSNKEVVLSFNIYETFFIKDHRIDTLGLGANVFLAKPYKGKLIGKQSVNVLKLNEETGFHLISFNYKKGMNLYFDSYGIYCTVEMLIGKLFE